jgi:hypothetical protein
MGNPVVRTIASTALREAITWPFMSEEPRANK